MTTYNTKAQNMIEQVQEKGVEIAASTSIGSVLISYLPIVTDVLQLVATIVAVGSAVLAFKIYKIKLKSLEGGTDSESSKDIQRRPSQSSADRDPSVGNYK